MAIDPTTKTILPQSRSSFVVNFCGVIVLLLCLVFLKDPLQGNIVQLGFVSICAMIFTVLCGEIFYLKSWQRQRVSWTKDGKRNWGRILTKLLALNVTLILVLTTYLVLHLPHSQTYETFMLVFFSSFPIVLLVGNLYILLLDHRLGSPEDGLMHFGNFLIGRWKEANNQKIIDYGKSVILRTYFVAPMTAYFFAGLYELFMDPSLYTIKTSGHYLDTSVVQLMGLWVYGFCFMALIDVSFAAIGYMMCFKALDSDVRSTDPTIFGWLICLCCYTPIFEMLMIPMIFQYFFNTPLWYTWFEQYPTIFMVWGGISILAIAMECSATMTFGIRFSNLTYRGLVSTGLFRYTKHPQYVSKMFNRFFMYVPILSLTGWGGMVLSLLCFFVLIVIYYLRARTEENHLSRYPEYVEYAHIMNQYSVFRGVAKILPFLRYDHEKAMAGKLF